MYSHLNGHKRILKRKMSKDNMSSEGKIYVRGVKYSENMRAITFV